MNDAWQALVKASEAANNEHRWADAEMLLSEQLPIPSTEWNAHALYQLARARVGLRQEDQALTAFEQAEESFDSIGLTFASGLCHKGQAECLEVARRWDDAFEEWLAASGKFRSETSVDLELAALWFAAHIAHSYLGASVTAHRLFAAAQNLARKMADPTRVDELAKNMAACAGTFEINSISRYTTLQEIRKREPLQAALDARAGDVRSILDIGCGPSSVIASVLAKQCSGARYVGVDLDPRSREMITTLRTTSSFASADYVECDFRYNLKESLSHADLPVGYDFVIASDVIGFWSSPEQCFDVLASVASAGASILVLTSSSRQMPWLKIGRENGPNELAKKAQHEHLRVKRSWELTSHLEFLTVGDLREFQTEHVSSMLAVPGQESRIRHLLEKAPQFGHMDVPYETFGTAILELERVP